MSTLTQWRLPVLTRTTGSLINVVLKKWEITLILVFEKISEGVGKRVNENNEVSRKRVNPDGSGQPVRIKLP